MTVKKYLIFIMVISLIITVLGFFYLQSAKKEKVVGPSEGKKEEATESSSVPPSGTTEDKESSSSAKSADTEDKEMIEESKTEEESIKEQVLSEPAYKNLVKAYEEGELTDPIFNEFIKVVAFVKQPDLCWELAQELRQECVERAYILRAKREDDTEICNNIPTPAWKDECYAQVLTRRAGEQNNPKICEQIIKEEDKIKCRNEF